MARVSLFDFQIESTALRQQLLHDLAMHVRQAELSKAATAPPLKNIMAAAIFTFTVDSGAWAKIMRSMSAATPLRSTRSDSARPAKRLRSRSMKVRSSCGSLGWDGPGGRVVIVNPLKGVCHENRKRAL